MEEPTSQLVLEHTLPLFGVECFGSALTDDGRFSRSTGVAPAPPVMRYDQGRWYTNDAWVRLVRHELNAQPGAWISTLVETTEKRVERSVANFDPEAVPEIIGNGICDMRGTIAPAMVIFALLGPLLEARLQKIFDHVGLDERERGKWVDVFSYPERKTSAMRERDEFLQLSAFVRKHPLDRSARQHINAYLQMHGYLGAMTPLGRPFTFADMMVRVSQVEGEPKTMRVEEELSRAQVLERAHEFMNRLGLNAPERDAIRAYRDLSFWRQREQELLALISTKEQQGLRRLSSAVGRSPEEVLWMQTEELTHALIVPKETIPSEVLKERAKHPPAVLFVEDQIKMLEE